MAQSHAESRKFIVLGGMALVLAVLAALGWAEFQNRLAEAAEAVPSL